MAPRIQYALTNDGVSIAFAVAGEGPALLMAPPIPFSHIQQEWEDPGYRKWLGALSGALRLIRYDNRGSGLSDRDVNDISPDALIADIEAVAAKLKLEQFAILGVCQSGPVAIAYALRHPEQISRLILWCTCATSPFENRDPQLQALDGVLQADWNLYTETLAHAMVAGWATSEAARNWSSLARAAIDRDGFCRFVDPGDYKHGDLTPRLPELQMPVLVLHRRDAPIWRLEAARKMAALIPDAEFVVLEGASLLPFVGDVDAVLRATFEFLGVEQAAQDHAPNANSLRIILFTDIEGHTAMMSRLGDDRGRAVLRESERITRDAIAHHGGAEIKALGDGFMASFGSAQRALECASSLQRDVAASAVLAAEHVRVRVGINAGEPIAEDDDLFGTSVIAAARIAAKAQGGEVLVSDVVRQLVAGKGFLFSERGILDLRGLDEPVRCWELRWS